MIDDLIGMFRELREAEERLRLAQADIVRLRSEVAGVLRARSQFQRRPESLRGRVRTIMTDNRLHSTGEIAIALGVDQSSVGDALKSLMRDPDERIRRVRPGSYRRQREWDG